MQIPQDVKLATECLQKCLPTALLEAPTPGCGIILGTGLSVLKSKLPVKFQDIPFEQIPHFPQLSVTSHAGILAAGLLGSMPVYIQQGRCHLYEGRAPAEICLPLRVMAALGCKRLIITNAAGSLNPLIPKGSLMCLADIINHTGVSPLTGPPWGERFPDMSSPFDPSLRSLASSLALRQGISLKQGVYIGVHGPEMETPAETRMYRQWGADAVGMSTALEVIAARHVGLDVLGISCITNQNLPDCMKPAPIEEVVAAANAVSGSLATLIAAVLASLASGENPC